MWGFIIALISGALMSIQGVFNTGITKSSSMWAANSWVQLTAFLVCVIAWFVTGNCISILETFVGATIIPSTCFALNNRIILFSLSISDSELQIINE